MTGGVTARAENAPLLAYFQSRMRPGTPADASPEEVKRPYDSLGAHPDLVMHLWDKITVGLPVACRRVVFGNPALVRPDSGVVFGFVVGTHVCALRLPPAVHAAALAAGAKPTHTWGNGSAFDAAAFGPGWTITTWCKDEPAWCLAAYEFAG